MKDYESYEFYKNFGYELIRIPYFIQFTNEVVEKLFNVKCNEKLFPEDIPSLYTEYRNTPAYLCVQGIKRMVKEFKNFPQQLEVNLDYLSSLKNEFLTGANVFKYYLNEC